MVRRSENVVVVGNVVAGLFDNNQDSSSLAWVRCCFSLDDMMHQACSVYANIKLRHHMVVIREWNTKFIETVRDVQLERQLIANFESELAPLLKDHKRWRQRKTVQEAVELELCRIEPSLDNNANHILSVPAPETIADHTLAKTSMCLFLGRPPTPIVDSLLASVLNQWRAVHLYLGLIQNPESKESHLEHLTSAEHFCGTYAALESRPYFLSSEALGLYLSGLTFGASNSHKVLLMQYMVTNSILMLRRRLSGH